MLSVPRKHHVVYRLYDDVVPVFKNLLRLLCACEVRGINRRERVPQVFARLRVVRQILSFEVEPRCEKPRLRLASKLLHAIVYLVPHHFCNALQQFVVNLLVAKPLADGSLDKTSYAVCLNKPFVRKPQGKVGRDALLARRRNGLGNLLVARPDSLFPPFNGLHKPNQRLRKLLWRKPRVPPVLANHDLPVLVVQYERVVVSPRWLLDFRACVRIDIAGKHDNRIRDFRIRLPEDAVFLAKKRGYWKSLSTVSLLHEAVWNLYATALVFEADVLVAVHATHMNGERTKRHWLGRLRNGRIHLCIVA